MNMGTSHFFNFIGEQNFHIYEQHYVYSKDFDNLRRSIRKMVMLLRNSDDVRIRDVHVNLRMLISKCLCFPLNFDQNLSNEIKEILGDINSTANLLGTDIAELYKISMHAIAELQKSENPLRVELRRTVEGIITDRKNFKIFCTRREREYFESIQINYGETKLKDEDFIYTLPQYRKSGFFDDIIKIGPFRSSGWSYAPDAIFTAPLFKRLVQILWNGCNDEEGFGYDPVTFFQNEDEMKKTDYSDDGIEFIGPIKWKKLINKPAEIPETYQDEELLNNEFDFYLEKDNSLSKFSANMIQIAQNIGIFKKTKSKLLVYNLKENLIDYQILEESSPEGLFFLETNLDNVDFGLLKAKADHYSQTWKEKLKFESQKDMKGLLKLLNNAGVNLINLEQAIKNLWIKPTARVIHAPHSMNHFRILLNVLGFGEKMVQTRYGLRPFCELATLEIRRSRGEAIQTGLNEHEIVDEVLNNLLNDLIPEISSHASDDSSFKFTLDPDRGLSGVLYFYKILSIESGFTVPQNEIDRHVHIDLCDQWRD